MGRRRRKGAVGVEPVKTEASPVKVDPLIVFDRHGEQTTALRNLLAEAPAFLLGGGPSANTLPLYELSQRGIFSLAINNMAGHFRTNAFTCSDPPSKFTDAIWLDPCMMKIIPIQKLCKKRGGLRTKTPDGFHELIINGKTYSTVDCPNTWGFARRAWWKFDDTFFTEPDATWGNNNGGVVRTQNPKILNTMLLAIRILYYLGARIIFLVGVDFTMTAESGYAFDQGRTSHACNNNNSQYTVTNAGLCEMVKNGVFERAGLEIYNCNPLSGLRAFAHAPFSSAIQETLKHFPKAVDLSGWYEKKPEKEEHDSRLQQEAEGIQATESTDR